MRAIQFDRYGDIDVLQVAEVDRPEPGLDELLVEVRAAGINPGEAAIREGKLHDVAPARFPSGQGSDFAGVVRAVGAGVTDIAVGDEVLGWSWDRASQAEYVAVPAGQVTPKPAGLDWTVAGALYVVGVTAYAAVRAVDPKPGETVAVSAASGGVGSLVVQLLSLRDVRTIGIASPTNHPWLSDHDVIPVRYGDHLVDRIRSVAAHGVDAFIDLFGPEYIDVALALGVRPDRIETIISYEAAERHGTKAQGSQDASTPEILATIADLVADGKVEVPIAAVYPFDEVRTAYKELEQRHTHGKIVLVPDQASA